MPSKGLLLLTLNTFSSTGGIEKVCRVAGKALHEIAEERVERFRLFSVYDRSQDLLSKYLPSSAFFAFGGNRLRFVKKAITAGRGSHTVVLSHIHLLPVGFLIKLLSPRTQLVLIAHGIEVWKKLSFGKIAALKRVDVILPVSHFTKNKMVALNRLREDKFVVLNNCLDPFLERTMTPLDGKAEKAAIGFADGDKVLFTLTRLKSTERYKGYDRVIQALPQIVKKHPTVKYLIAGRYDEAEKARLDDLIHQQGVGDRVVFTGFVPDDRLQTLFSVADVYVMPSTGEGFGIVFIEALFYGKPVIAGNADGSVDAVAGGKLGLLINPDSTEEIAASVDEVLENPAPFIPNPSEVISRFGFAAYKLNLTRALGLEAPTKKHAARLPLIAEEKR